MLHNILVNYLSLELCKHPISVLLLLIMNKGRVIVTWNREVKEDACGMDMLQAGISGHQPPAS